jgi:hypothetical protein
VRPITTEEAQHEGAGAGQDPPRASVPRRLQQLRSDPAKPSIQARRPPAPGREDEGAFGSKIASRLRRLRPTRPAKTRRPANAGKPANAPKAAKAGRPWTPPPPPARLVRRQGPPGPAPRRKPPGLRPNLPGPPVGRDALMNRAAPPAAWNAASGPPPQSALSPGGDGAPPGWPAAGLSDLGPVVTPDDDTRGRTVIDEERAAAQARREARHWRDAPPPGVHFVETFHGPRLGMRIARLRRVRSSFMLVVLAALMAVVIAALLAGIVGGIAIAISHASGSG